MIFSFLNKNIFFLLSLSVITYFSCSNGGGEEADSSEITVEKVYGDGSKYCAFTSLLKQRGVYYLAFREGDSHVGAEDYGIIKILCSKDAKQWRHYQTIQADDKDLRDPQLTSTPDGHMLLLCGARMYNAYGDYFYTKSYYAIEDGGVFSEAKPVNVPPEIDDSYCCWLWRLTWNGKNGYGAAYRNDGTINKLTLLKTPDGIHYTIVTDISADQVINETKIQFLPGNEMIALFRSDREGYIGHSLPPYTEWNLKKTNIYLAGHDCIALDNHLICSTRMITNIGERTALWFGNPEGNFQWSYLLPSAGDTSYPSIVEENDRLLISYYSMHQTEKPSVYLAIIPKAKLPYINK